MHDILSMTNYINCSSLKDIEDVVSIFPRSKSDKTDHPHLSLESLIFKQSVSKRIPATVPRIHQTFSPSSNDFTSPSLSQESQRSSTYFHSVVLQCVAILSICSVVNYPTFNHIDMDSEVVSLPSLDSPKEQSAMMITRWVETQFLQAVFLHLDNFSNHTISPPSSSPMQLPKVWQYLTLSSQNIPCCFGHVGHTDVTSQFICGNLSAMNSFCKLLPTISRMILCSGIQNAGPDVVWMAGTLLVEYLSNLVLLFSPLAALYPVQEANLYFHPYLWSQDKSNEIAKVWSTPSNTFQQFQNVDMNQVWPDPTILTR